MSHPQTFLSNTLNDRPVFEGAISGWYEKTVRQILWKEDSRDCFPINNSDSLDNMTPKGNWSYDSTSETEKTKKPGDFWQGIRNLLCGC